MRTITYYEEFSTDEKIKIVKSAIEQLKVGVIMFICPALTYAIKTVKDCNFYDVDENKILNNNFNGLLNLLNEYFANNLVLSAKCEIYVNENFVFCDGCWFRYDMTSLRIELLELYLEELEKQLTV